MLHLLALLGRNDFLGTNALAYFGSSPVTKKKFYNIGGSWRVSSNVLLGVEAINFFRRH